MVSTVRKILGRFFVPGETAFVLKGAVVTGMLQGFGMVLTYVSQILLARWLGVRDYGVYAFSLSLTILLANLVCFGLPILSIRSISISIETGEHEKARGFLRFALGLVLFTSLSVSVLGALLLTFFWEHVDPAYRHALPMVLFWIVPFAFLFLLVGVSRGFHWAAMAFAPRTVFFPLLLILFCWIFFARLGDLTLLTVLRIAFGASLFLALAQLAAIAWKSRTVLEPSGRKYEIRAWIAAAVPLFFNAAFIAIESQGDVLLIGIFLNPDDVGVYAVVRRTGVLVASFLTAINSMLAPRIAALYARDEGEKLQKVLQSVVVFLALPTILITLMIVLFRFEILRLFGPAYVAGEVPLIVLMVGYIVNASVGPCAFLLSMTGNERVLAYVRGGATGLALALNLVLIPAFGILGAAVAASTTMAALNVALWLIGWKKTGIDTSILCLLRRREK